MTENYQLVCPFCGKHTPFESLSNFEEQDDFIVSERECAGYGRGLPETRQLTLLEIEEEEIYDLETLNEIYDMMKRRIVNIVRIAKRNGLFEK